ncbi:MAG: hypothetical protein KDA85_01590 [Planctomycetaceae bacterium]|nr:hypothetical protein [Planctomycetaceae bacterium]
MRILATLVVIFASGVCSVGAADEPLKVFILAGQSNMVGWGDSAKLTDELQRGSDRVLMFENGHWQPLRPIRKAQKNQEALGMTENTFGPEIAFGQEMARAWPDEQIGIIKFAVGGTSILTWKPDWSKEDADRVGQGQVGSLYQKLIQKVEDARNAREIEIVGVLWLQGGGDMKNQAIAKEYLPNLRSLVAAIRKDTQCPDLPFFCGTMRRAEDPDDLSAITPKRVDGPWPAVEFVLKAQWDAKREISHFHPVILREIEKHPMNVHYNTAGQLEVGKLFAAAYLATQRAVEE